MSSIFSSILTAVGGALLSAAGNAPATSIEAVAMKDIEGGLVDIAGYNAGNPVVAGTFTEGGVEGAVIVLKTSSPAYAALFPPASPAA